MNSENATKPPAASPICTDNRRVFVFYHYLFPDNVVSAIHYEGLCEGLVHRGWQVTAFPGNRGCRDEDITYAPFSVHNSVKLHRIWRPRFRQASFLGRLFNAGWMIARWSLLALRPNPPAAVIVGTDPILSVAVSIIWKFIRPRTRILHWVFDLYPEAAYADGLLSPRSLSANLIERVLRHAYAACDAIVDIGPCMRRRLARYPSAARQETIVPWALEEPAEVLPISRLERDHVFGGTRMAMLYSGTFGRAHAYEGFLALAHALRAESAMLAFSVRGNRENELRSALDHLQNDLCCPVKLVPFTAPEKLLQRLSAPDIHLLSLIPSWTGLVVPSKFFGALAVGRPIIYNGSPESSIAQWIEEFELGWVLTPHNVEAIAAQLTTYMEDEQRVHAMQQRCHATYRAHFSREASLDRMHAVLSAIVDRAPGHDRGVPDPPREQIT